MSPCRFWPLLPHFLVDPGGISKCLILVVEQSWGQRRIRGSPPFFLSQLLFAFFVCFQEFEVALQNILALPSWDLTWCDINREPLSFVGPTVPPQLVVSDPSLANLAQLRFRNPDSFRAGNLHNHADFWENLIFSTGHACSKVSLLQIIREGVKVYDFFRHFRETLKGDTMILLFRQLACFRTRRLVLTFATSLILRFWIGFLRMLSKFTVWSGFAPLRT